MKQLIFGILIGGLFAGELNAHGFLQAIGITTVFVIVVVIIYKWINGEFDKAIEEKKDV